MAQEHKAPGELSDSEMRNEKGKFVLGKVAKYLMWGALIGGLLFAAAPVLLGVATGGMAVGAVPGAGPLAVLGLFTETGRGIAGNLLGKGLSAALSTGTIGALVFGGVAAVAGLASGLSGMNAHATDMNEDSVANAERELQRKRQNAMLQSRGPSMPYVPQANLPYAGRDGREIGQG